METFLLHGPPISGDIYWISWITPVTLFNMYMVSLPQAVLCTFSWTDLEDPEEKQFLDEERLIFEEEVDHNRDGYARGFQELVNVIRPQYHFEAKDEVGTVYSLSKGIHMRVCVEGVGGCAFVCYFASATITLKLYGEWTSYLWHLVSGTRRLIFWGKGSMEVHRFQSLKILQLP